MGECVGEDEGELVGEDVGIFVGVFVEPMHSPHVTGQLSMKAFFYKVIFLSSIPAHLHPIIMRELPLLIFTCRGSSSRGRCGA